MQKMSYWNVSDSFVHEVQQHIAQINDKYKCLEDFRLLAALQYVMQNYGMEYNRVDDLMMTELKSDPEFSKKPHVAKFARELKINYLRTLEFMNWENI